MASTPLHPLFQQRRAGILLHVSSLPSGEMGEDAFAWIDCLKAMGVTVWQTLPLTMPHGDGSPYQSLSSHAGNPAFISINALVKEGWLLENEVHPTSDRSWLLSKAYDRFALNATTSQRKAFEQFCAEQAFWLDDFGLFCVLRQHFNLASWVTWPTPYKRRDKQTLKKCRAHFATAIGQIKFQQFLFFQQWSAVKKYANKRGVFLFGDIPIFVAFDSADVWAQPHLFKLDAELQMTVVAGVPPDYFSELGQRWGNPHYNWDAMEHDRFRWWVARMKTQNAMFDMLRIDHFRGLEAAWEIPATEETAVKGAWQPAPGDALIKAILKALPDLALVAEDLGVITEEVDALRLKYGMPGMKILQFAFGAGAENPYLPDHFDEACVAYTGTHDNDTTLGWFNSITPEERAHFMVYVGDPHPPMPETLIRLALNSVACLAVIPLQDIMALDTAHRMNIPGTVEGNWRWRFEWPQFTMDQQLAFKQAVKRSKRK